MVTYHWMNLDKDGNELPEDEFLSHLSDQDILGLMDSYDDGRINKLCVAFVTLRKESLDIINDEVMAARMEAKEW